MADLIIDTSVYVDFFRGRILQEDPLIRILTGVTHLIHLSSVVAQELFAGAPGAKAISQLENFCADFEAFGRLVTPTRRDWMECGRVLARIGDRFGFETVKRGRLVNDVLIALSCAQIEARLVTFNEKDFRIISDFVDFEMDAPVKPR